MFVCPSLCWAAVREAREEREEERGREPREGSQEIFNSHAQSVPCWQPNAEPSPLRQ